MFYGSTFTRVIGIAQIDFDWLVLHSDANVHKNNKSTILNGLVSFRYLHYFNQCWFINNDAPLDNCRMHFTFVTLSCSIVSWLITRNKASTLRPRQNGRHFPDDTFKRIFLNEKVRISIKISLKFVPKGPINNIPALVQIMAWRRSGDKPLSEPMMVSLLTHICVTRPQWANDLFTKNTCLSLSLARYDLPVIRHH